MAGHDSVNENGKGFVQNMICIAICAVTLYNQLPQIYKGFLRMRKLEETGTTLSERVASEKKRLSDLQKEIASLDDVFYREKLARNKMRMIKKGEIIYQLIEEKGEEEKTHAK